MRIEPDGQGWESMENVLAEAYDAIVDLYNLHQADAHLVPDIRAAIDEQPVP